MNILQNLEISIKETLETNVDDGNDQFLKAVDKSKYHASVKIIKFKKISNQRF